LERRGDLLDGEIFLSGPRIDDAEKFHDVASVDRVLRNRSQFGGTTPLADGLLFEPVQQWWKPRAFAALKIPLWMKGLLSNSQPTLVGLQQKITALTLQLQAAAKPDQPRELGLMTSVIIDREIGDWHRFHNRRQVGSYTGLCPSEYSSGHTPAPRLHHQTW